MSRQRTTGAKDSRRWPWSRRKSEEFPSTIGVQAFTRSAAAPGTGVDSPREQVNQLSSYIDGAAVYGSSEAARRVTMLRTRTSRRRRPANDGERRTANDGDDDGDEGDDDGEDQLTGRHAA